MKNNIVYIKTDLRARFGKTVGSYWLPYKIIRRTPTLFILSNGLKFRSKNGVGYGNHFVAKEAGSFYGGVEVVDQSKEYNRQKALIENKEKLESWVFDLYDGRGKYNIEGERLEKALNLLERLLTTLEV